MSDTQFKGLVAAILLVGVVVLLLLLRPLGRGAPGPAPAPPPVTAPRSPALPVTTLAVGLGHDAFLRNGSADVDVAVDQKALLALADAARVRNVNKYDAVFDKGRAYRVPDGTRVRIEGAGLYSGRVLILSGAAAGRTGYVPQEWVANR